MFLAIALDCGAPHNAAMNTHAPIQRRPLHDELVQRLREMIMEGQLAPAEKISEVALTSYFAVSRTPLREALKVLVSEGLLGHTHNRGFVVNAVTRQDLEEVFPILGSLEALAGETACREMSDGEIAAVRDLHVEMVGHYEAGDLANYFRCNQAIHEAILSGSRNATLIGIYEGLSGRVRRARYVANLSAERWKRAVDEHEAILHALERRDAGMIARLLRDHLEHKLDAVRPRFDKADDAI